jgi:homogentisate 1,2-dioxygenase
MIDYRRLGEVSKKPHTVFKVNGEMMAEHVFTREGFSDLFSILYQKRAPTHEREAAPFKNGNAFFANGKNSDPKQLDNDSVNLADQPLLRRHFVTPQIPYGKTMLSGRATLLQNADCSVGMAKFVDQDDVFFSNGDADELYFVTEGSGVLQTMFGEIDYSPNDYLFLPKGTVYRFLGQGRQSLFVVEGNRKFGIPAAFRHPQGQLKLDAPYSHRDFRSPERLSEGCYDLNLPIVVKKRNKLTLHKYTDWPYQVVGWDGWVFPFAFAISDYQTKTGSHHLPPSSHTVFEAVGFVIMNFVPRMLDYGTGAVPCPYPHTSVDCDEVLFYVDGNFTSRKAIAQHSISFHPCGIPHGPHPEKYEDSVGHKVTNELAVMVDTFAPLDLTAAALKFEDPTYHFTWNEEGCL